jgi:hypothetical protein
MDNHVFIPGSILDGLGIPHISDDQIKRFIAMVLPKPFQIPPGTRTGKVVKDGYIFSPRYQARYVIAADKTGTSGYQEFLLHHLLLHSPGFPGK